MMAAFTGLAAAVIGGIVLFPRFGYIGVAAAIALSGWVGATALGVVLFRRKWLHLDHRAAGNLPRIAFATALMGVTIAVAVATMTSLFPSLPKIHTRPLWSSCSCWSRSASSSMPPRSIALASPNSAT